MNLPAEAVAAGSLIRGFVNSVEEGTIYCDANDLRLSCDCLQISSVGLQLLPGDEVLIVAPTEPTGRGVVIGRIGTHKTAGEVPDELVLEAKQTLTLRVGEGSITIREDGKILIKGKDLVSHATRRNRIRGGSVEIN
jgi:hypothetical protein